MTKYRVKRRPKDAFTASQEKFERETSRAATIASVLHTEPHTKNERAFLDAVDRALRRGHLSGRERANLAYALRTYQGMTYSQIADLLGYASEAGARHAVTKMRYKLRAMTLAG